MFLNRIRPKCGDAFRLQCHVMHMHSKLMDLAGMDIEVRHSC